MIITSSNYNSDIVDKAEKEYIFKNDKSLKIIDLIDEELEFAKFIDKTQEFYNINHEILLNKLESDIYDKDVINLVEIIIKETNNRLLAKLYLNTKIIKTAYYCCP